MIYDLSKWLSYSMVGSIFLGAIAAKRAAHWRAKANASEYEHRIQEYSDKAGTMDSISIGFFMIAAYAFVTAYFETP